MRLELSQNSQYSVTSLLLSLNVGSPGHVLGCLACADSWLCVGSVHSPRASECCWLCNTTRAVGAGVLLQLFQPPCFPFQKLDTPCSFHFIRHPQSPRSSTNGSSGPHAQVSLQKGPLLLLSISTQAAVPGLRLTGEPKGQHISTVVLCAKI